MTEEKKETKVSPWPWKLGTCTSTFNRGMLSASAEIPYIMDAEGSIICTMQAEFIGEREGDGAVIDDSKCSPNAILMSAAPELREELEKLVKRSCSMCAAEMKAAITPQNKPCEDGRPCPYGLDGAKKAIEKSYGKGD